MFHDVGYLYFHGYISICDNCPLNCIMERSYRRFKELRIKSKAHLRDFGDLKNQLQSAVIELVFLNDDEIPTLKCSEVQSILSDCKTTEPAGDEGEIRASINAMTDDQLNSLKRKIEIL